MPHPGDDWPHFCPRVATEPVLTLGGRRSIFSAWPPSAVCEQCGSGQVAGYAGATQHPEAITYPDPTVRYVCKPCARRAVGLGPDDLTGHNCQRQCSDTIHVDPSYVAHGELSDTDEAARIEHYRADYAARGWRVVGVGPADWIPATMGGDRWAVLFTASAPAHD